MKHSRQVVQGLLGARDFPAELFTGVPVIEIKGDSEAAVICHRGILSYEENRVQINSALGRITVLGKGLMIYRMNRERIQLKGTVFSVWIGEEGECLKR